MQEQLDRIEMKLVSLEGKIDQMYESSQMLRKYMLWAFWITVAVIVLPLLVLPLFLPAFMGAVTLPAGY